MKVLFLCTLILITNLLIAQKPQISIGIDVGLMQNWTKLTKDEAGVFINNQDLSYNIHENYKRFYIKYTGKFSYKLDITSAIYTDYICTLNNFTPPLTGKACGGTDWNANQINVNIGKEIKLFKWMYVQPSLGIGYVFFENFYNGDYSEGGGGGYHWRYSEMTFGLRSGNFNLNLGSEILFKLNPMFKLKFMYAYQQAFFKIYTTEIMAWQTIGPGVFTKPTDPSKIKYATIDGYGSNTQFGLGVEYVFAPSEKK
jgi:hypothetical protein